jgi:hypothetical protein
MWLVGRLRNAGPFFLRNGISKLVFVWRGGGFAGIWVGGVGVAVESAVEDGPHEGVWAVLAAEARGYGWVAGVGGVEIEDDGQGDALLPATGEADVDDLPWVLAGHGFHARSGWLFCK